MSSDSRRLRWWHWLLLALAVVLVLVYLASFTLEPSAVLAAGRLGLGLEPGE